MSNQLYMPKQIIIEQNSEQKRYDLNGAIQLGIQGAEGQIFALNSRTEIEQITDVSESQQLTIGKTGIYFLDLSGGKGLIQNILFGDYQGDVLIDYLVASTELLEGVQYNL